MQLSFCYLTDMGKVSSRGSLRQTKLGNSDHFRNLHYLPGTGEGGQHETVEIPLLPEVANTHPLPVDSCELINTACIVVTYHCYMSIYNIVVV